MLGTTLESPVNSSYRHRAASATNAVGTTAEGKTYTANSLNQYTTIDDFTPQYDADGNQILIKTETGIWSVVYNAENRPIRWQSGDTVITMAFDRMGRRVEMRTQSADSDLLQLFVYDNYLCIQHLRVTDNALFQSYVWVSTEPISTSLLMLRTVSGEVAYCFYDGNKNVSDLVVTDTTLTAHYAYTPFGAVTVTGSKTLTNPFRFSSEFYDDVLGLVYYNYRHYDIITGRWISRDPLAQYSFLLTHLNRWNEKIKHALYENLNTEYSFVDNPIFEFDYLGLLVAGDVDEWGEGRQSRGNCWRYVCNDPAKGNERSRINPPGTPSQEKLNKDACAKIISSVIFVSGGRFPESNGNCPMCYYKVLLVIQEYQQPYGDYHWYRQDDDGTWSHKPGDFRVRSGVPNPERDAEERKYPIKCGYLCFPASGLDADKK